MNDESIAKKKSSFSYLVFGLRLYSSLPLPGLSPSQLLTEEYEIELHLGVRPYPDEKNSRHSEEVTYVSTDTNTAGEPALRILEIDQGNFVRLAYEDGTQFWVDRNRENIWATWPSDSSVENAATYLLGPVLGLLLRLRGITCLHASAVAFGDYSVAFVGSAGAGKSTTAAAFAQRGCGVISDDIAALTETSGAFHVMPAYRHLSLWPESVRMIYHSPEALPRFLPGWDKRRLALGDQGTRFEDRCLPLGAIYILGDRRSDPAPYVEPVKPQDALLALVTDTYANKVLDREMRAREFDFLGRLITAVPIRRVYANEDPHRLEDLCRTVRRDFVSLTSGQPTGSKG